MQTLCNAGLSSIVLCVFPALPADSAVKREEVALRSWRFTFECMSQSCTHFGEIRSNVKPRTVAGCEECLKMGDTWVHLRLCMTCGHVGCCDSSKNKHATRHYHDNGHPIIKSFQPDEEWGYCYPDDLVFDSLMEETRE